MSIEVISANELKKIVKAKGASIVGIADIEEIENTPEYTLKGKVHKFSRAISIGVKLSDEIINGIINGPTLDYAEHYRQMNAKLDEISEAVMKVIVDMGYNAMNIPASKRYDHKKLAAIFPHKTAAILSGLGWIGRSALLISHDHGPRIRLTTVFTNLPLLADIPQKESECGDCTNCVDACPANAITGELWTFGVERDVIFNAFKCRDHTAIQKKKVGETICGICISVCPYG